MLRDPFIDGSISDKHAFLQPRRVGKSFLTNYNVTILDIMPVTIGDYVMIGPNTMISTVNHPISPMGRRKHLGVGKPVTIGNDVWIGGNVTILPGVHIGDNTVIGAGSIVTKDIPDNVLAAGNPCRDAWSSSPSRRREGPFQWLPGLHSAHRLKR